MDEYIDLIEYEGLYKINKLGDIWSCISKKNMKFRSDKDGYFRVEIRKNGIPKSYFKHRLLALQFIPNDDPINKKEVDHIDRNNINNSLDNLRWATRIINSKNRKRFGIVREYVRGNNQSNFFQANYTYYDQNGKTIRLKKKNNDKEKVENWLQEVKILYPINI
jgi:hypothetical protein